MVKKAIITGISGQDGSYLAEYLLTHGYEVHGIVRTSAIREPAHALKNILHIRERVSLHSCRIDDFQGIRELVRSVRPDEYYHLAAQSSAIDSYEIVFDTLNINVFGTLSGLASVRELSGGCRFFFAASSEMFGLVRETPQSETTAFYPRSPYGISKVTGFDLTRNYRETHGMYAVSGILFNHESPRRAPEFVSRKISLGVAKIKLGRAKFLYLGNLDARRDWGHSREYVKQMHAMLQQQIPEDFVIATGETHSVREFCEIAFAELDMDYRDFVRVDTRLFRANDSGLLVGDPSKARNRLGWTPEIQFRDLVREMVWADIEGLRTQKEV